MLGETPYRYCDGRCGRCRLWDECPVAQTISLGPIVGDAEAAAMNRRFARHEDGDFGLHQPLPASASATERAIWSTACAVSLSVRELTQTIGGVADDTTPGELAAYAAYDAGSAAAALFRIAPALSAASESSLDAPLEDPEVCSTLLLVLHLIQTAQSALMIALKMLPPMFEITTAWDALARFDELLEPWLQRVPRPLWKELATRIEQDRAPSPFGYRSGIRELDGDVPVEPVW